MIKREFFGKKLFLLLCVLGLLSSAAADGLPGEFLLTERWRSIHTPYSSVTNPAFIAEENYLSLRGAIAPVLEGAFTLSDWGVNIPLSLYHTASVSALIESDGSVVRGVEDESGRLTDDIENAISKSNTNLFFSFGYAWHVWQHLVIGANLNFAYQSNFGNSLQGTGVDVGATYRLLKHPMIGEHIVGMATQNLIAPSMGDTWIPKWGNDAEYSRNLRLSWNSKYWENRIENYMDLNFKDFVASAKNFDYDVSYLKRIEWDLNWRVGFWAMRMFKSYLMFGFDEDILDYWGLALGVNMPAFNMGRDLSAFYQYNIMTEENNDATSHTFYVKADIGKHREEVYARRMARLASLSPNDLYNKARKLYSQKKYWDAFFVFSRIAVEFPDFFKNDYVNLFRADCQEQMDMRDQAIVNYNETKSKYPLSSVVPYADLGLMRIHYRNNDFAQASNQWVELNQSSVPDSLRFHGAYLMGQINLQNGEYRKAIHAFSVIPDSHPDYVHAQHATAVGHALQGSEMEEVIMALENVISTQVNTPEAKEIVNRSYLFLGYIFYEEDALSKAVVALRMIPDDSYYAEDALLGKGWTAIKARQWNDCISTGKKLEKVTDKGVLKCESKLIQAYGHLLQKDYEKALAVLEEANTLSSQLTIPVIDSLNMKRLNYDNQRMEFSQLSDEVEDYSTVGSTSHLVKILDSLKTSHANYLEKFDNFYEYKNNFHRKSFFSRGMDQVREDIEYALATVQKIMGQSDIHEESQKIEEETEDLDEEIQKLRREMEQMEEGEDGEEEDQTHGDLGY
ncbi:MAG: tetratricopeptide repeat protein [Chitinispirillaceae bacterium]